MTRNNVTVKSNHDDNNYAIYASQTITEIQEDIDGTAFARWKDYMVVSWRANCDVWYIACRIPTRN